jgi:hypothetical protein
MPGLCVLEQRIHLSALSGGESHCQRSLNTGPPVSSGESICLTTRFSIVTRLRAGWQKTKHVSILDRGKILTSFPEHPDRRWGPSRITLKEYRDAFPPPFSYEVKNSWRYISIPLHAFMTRRATFYPTIFSKSYNQWRSSFRIFMQAVLKAMYWNSTMCVRTCLNIAMPDSPSRRSVIKKKDETFFHLSVFLPNVDGSARGERTLAFFIHLDVLLQYVT